MLAEHFWAGVARHGQNPVRHAVDTPMIHGLGYKALCGVLVAGLNGQRFGENHPRACPKCIRLTRGAVQSTTPTSGGDEFGKF